MRANGWKSACRKLVVAMGCFKRYDTCVSGGGHRRSAYTGEVKCIRNSLLSHWRQSFWQDVIQLVKRLDLGLDLVLLAQRSLAAMRLLAQSLVLVQLTPVKLATSATSTHNTASPRGIENLKGMAPVRDVPFCLPKA